MAEKSILSNEPLTKKELNKCWWRFFCGLGHGGYDLLMGSQWMWGLGPVFSKYYDEKKKCAELKRHSEFYNTEPIFGSVINGIVVAMEEQKALGKNVDNGMIQATKLSLMGPMAGIGDALNPGLIVPLLLSIAINLSQNGSLLGVLFYIIAYNAAIIAISKILFNKGYQLGTDALGILVSEKANRVKDAFLLLGTIIVGGISASYINFNLKLAIPSGNDMVPVQGMLDGIFPKMLPLAIVLGTWYVLSKKNISTAKMMLVFFGVVLVLSLIGIV